MDHLGLKFMKDIIIKLLEIIEDNLPMAIVGLLIAIVVLSIAFEAIVKAIRCGE